MSKLLKYAEIPVQVIGEATAFQPWFLDREVHGHRGSLGFELEATIQIAGLAFRSGDS
ncbi:MAG: hypothetical protein AB8B86_09665 [Pseudomonadales bacterium]